MPSAHAAASAPTRGISGAGAASQAFSARIMRLGMTRRRMSLAEPAARSAARRASA